MIYGKVWGSTEPILVTPFIEVHKIATNPGYRCSEHKHEHKWNGFYCVSGLIDINVRKNDYDLIDTTTLSPGMFTTVKPNEYHWFHSKSACVVLEIYYPEPLRDDIIRTTVGGLNDDN